MSKRYSIVFNNSEQDKALLKASVSALQSDVLSARFGHTVIHDDSSEKTTLQWWRLPEGGFDVPGT